MNYQILSMFLLLIGSTPVSCFLVGQLDLSERTAFVETELTGYIAFLKIHWRHVGYGAKSCHCLSLENCELYFAPMRIQQSLFNI